MKFIFSIARWRVQESEDSGKREGNGVCGKKGVRRSWWEKESLWSISNWKTDLFWKRSLNKMFWQCFSSRKDIEPSIFQQNICFLCEENMTQEIIFFPVSATNSLNKQEQAPFSSDTSVFPSTDRSMSVVLKHTGQPNGTERWCLGAQMVGVTGGCSLSKEREHLFFSRPKFSECLNRLYRDVIWASCPNVPQEPLSPDQTHLPLRF